MIIGRIIGWLFLAAAIAVLGWDLARIGEEGPNGEEAGFTLAPVGRVWAEIDTESLQLAQAGTQRHIAPWLWGDIIQPILEMPAVLVFGVLALILLFLFRKRKD
jgi:hypothetical protein